MRCANRGASGTGYELSEVYFLPPLLFTATEAQALSLSADAERALAKISLVLPKFCCLRHAPRDFRLNRIESRTLLDGSFRPRDLARSAADAIEVRVRFAAEVVRWVRERPH